MGENHLFQAGLESPGGFQGFHELLRYRIKEILLVSSLYDYYILSEEGGLYESVFDEHVKLGLSGMPRITRASSPKEAIALLEKDPGRFHLVITLLSASNMQAFTLAHEIKALGCNLPVALLAWQNRIADETVRKDLAVFDKVFIWQGDFRIFLAIIKYFEDRLNVEDDTKLVGVESVIVIEDDPRFYSSFLPVIYKEIFEHTAKLISNSLNQAQKRLRLKARPKILLCSTFEEALEYFETYSEYILGIISDIAFLRGNRVDPEAGFRFLEKVRQLSVDVPVLLQSSDIRCRARSEAAGAAFLHKTSDMLLSDLRVFMLNNMGFGDFIFRLPNGQVVGSAKDLKTMEEQIPRIPNVSIRYHAERNHFSRWLKTRTEHLFASRIHSRTASEFETDQELKDFLIKSFSEYRLEEQRGNIVSFDARTFDPEFTFARIGNGSLGGKTRGIGFANSLINLYSLENRYKDIKIAIPPTIALATEVFDHFMERNSLWEFALQCTNDEEIVIRFSSASLPEEVLHTLWQYLELARYPIAVRSSSLLEDSHEMPFAGIYATFMLANNQPLQERFRLLELAIKRVYASTFSRQAKLYIKSTPYRLEEEKMGVIIQKLTGRHHEDRFYPDFAGVACSHNYYPFPPMKTEDGIACVALGLGQLVVEGRMALRFCPRYPAHLVQFSNVDDVLHNSQSTFLALKTTPDTQNDDFQLSFFDLEIAGKDGVLAAVSSTYSADNNSIYDSSERSGIPVITFAPILKYKTFPLAEILDLLLRIAEHGLSSPVELEFAVDLSSKPKNFSLLQVRPIVTGEQGEYNTQAPPTPAHIIVQSAHVLGNGSRNGISDIVTINLKNFDRKLTHQIAKEISVLNWELSKAGIHYVLIGMGRWGSQDPWLGLPVRWEDISNARIIVETGLPDIQVTPSQGTHFFHNVCSAGIGYFTVQDELHGDSIDWDWLSTTKSVTELNLVRHIHLKTPLTIFMDGKTGSGFIGREG